MFDHIRNLISDCEAVESIKENRYSPENGIIYLRLNTDDNVAPQLRYSYVPPRERGACKRRKRRHESYTNP